MAKSKKLSPFARFSKQQIIIALVFILGFGGFGVYKLAFSSASDISPPTKLTREIRLENITASDGLVSMVSCLSVAAQTWYGPLANCIQLKPPRGAVPERWRTGFFNLTTRKFSQTGGWLANTVGNIGSSKQCKNMSYGFNGPYPLDTIYGPISYGQIYRYYGGRLQIKWAHMSMADGKCHPSGGWMEAKAW